VVQDEFGHIAIIHLADGSEQPHRLINIPADKLAALGTPLPASDSTSDEDDSAFKDARSCLSWLQTQEGAAS
jgi:hypothetical protein